MMIQFRNKTPQIAASAFIAPNATLIGDVIIEENASIWFGAVLRGDFGKIIVSRGANVQDNAVIHSEEDIVTEIGEEVTVGHCAVLEGCTIGRGSVVGMNAVVLGGAQVGEEVMIAAGSVVREHARIPPRVLVAGQPAVVKKELSGSALNWTQTAARGYREIVKEYAAIIEEPS